MSKKKVSEVEERTTRLVDEELPELMEAILKETELPVEERATRLNLVQTALHHLKLLRARLT